MWSLQVGVDLLKLAICWCHSLMPNDLCIFALDAKII